MIKRFFRHRLMETHAKQDEIGHRLMETNAKQGEIRHRLMETNLEGEYFVLAK